jgi:hypothetical protein
MEEGNDTLETELLARLQEMLTTRGLRIELLDYGGLGLPGDDGWHHHALLVDSALQVVADGWGMTAADAVRAATIDLQARSTRRRERR